MPHPITLSFAGVADERNRLTAFFRPLMILPHLIWVALWGIAAVIVAIIGWFMILIQGHMAAWAHDFIARYVRCMTHVYAYGTLTTDEYPGFSGRGPYPLDVSISGPADQHRGYAAVRLIIAIPALILAQVLQDVLAVVVFFSWVLILFTGRQIAGLAHIATWIIRVQIQTLGYVALLTERYPVVDIEYPDALAPSPA